MDFYNQLNNNIDIIVKYMFGSLFDEDGCDIRDCYKLELNNYCERINDSFNELIRFRQTNLTPDNIAFALEYEMIGYTCNPHPKENKDEFYKLVNDLYKLYQSKL